MAYRIRYGRKTEQWTLIKWQSVLSAGIFLMVLLGNVLFPQVKEIFRSTPNRAQRVLAEGYARGEGLRDCAVIYCASVLECAGYETESIR